MTHKLTISICIPLLLLAACCPSTSVPTPAFTYVPTFTPPPAVTQTLIPTTSPIPTLALTIRWPATVSALQPIPIEVELAPPPGIAASSKVSATVLNPDYAPYQTFTLAPREGNLYVSEELLQLPLEPTEGDWWVKIEVESELRVEGRRYKSFQPAPIPFRNLTEALPPGTDLHVPNDFTEVVAQGDRTAGGRVWRYAQGEVSLWWAPGPTKPLLLNNAVVMLEATYDTDGPTTTSGEEMEWQDRPAFLFYETWPGPEGGPGEALVVQGPDYWLYVLRVRAVGGESIPQLIRQVGETLVFLEE